LAVLRNAEPAFRCSFQKSPSALMMPFPNKSHDRFFTNSPLVNKPSFLKTKSRFCGLWMSTPGGRVGTLRATVS
jgi:hypothetical protein